jgi:transposase-like protein
VRRAIQQSQASLKVLATRHAINPKTVAKWRKRGSVDDAKMGPKEARSTVPTPEQEAACVALREQTLLPLDDCPCALQASIPGLTRSALHRCSRRHGISRLPEVAGTTPPKKAFREYPIGYFHIDIAEVRTEEGKLALFVAIDRTAKSAYAELLPRAGKLAAAQFLRNLVAAVP